MIIKQEIISSKENKLKNPKLIIFDWSGVISDDRKPVYETHMRMFDKRGKKRYTFDEWLPQTKLSPREFFQSQGFTEDPEEIFFEYAQIYKEVRSSGIKPTVYPDVQQILSALYNLKISLVVLSSHPEESLLKESKDYGLKEYFLLIKGNISDKTQGLLDICNQLNIEPKTTTYIGDTIWDIQAAKKAGLYSVSVATGYQLMERLTAENPFIAIENMSQLLDRIAM